MKLHSLTTFTKSSWEELSPVYGFCVIDLSHTRAERIEHLLQQLHVADTWLQCVTGLVQLFPFSVGPSTLICLIIRYAGGGGLTAERGESKTTVVH